jgi:signal transduction histidine kinase
MGLGLNIVKVIIEGHGGTVLVEAAPGGGARFVMSLPVAEGGATGSVSTDERD